MHLAESPREDVARGPSGAVWPFRALLALFLVVVAAMGNAEEIGVNSAAVLRAKFTDLAGHFDNNSFGKPVALESSDASGNSKGRVYAVLPHAYPAVRAALKEPAQWCDILILHLNTKYCRALSRDGAAMLQVNIGRKSDQPIEQSYRVDLSYRLIDSGPDHFAVVLEADKGPLGTREYRILLEAVPIRDGQTFMHLAYSYSYGTAAKLGLMAYLGTAGSTKVGFTVTGKRNDGRPIYIDGLRGLVERNTMRYYLAIESYLGALSVPPPARLEKRLADWYAAAERYPVQLHEIERQDYLDMKRREYQRQQSRL